MSSIAGRLSGSVKAKTKMGIPILECTTGQLLQNPDFDDGEDHWIVLPEWSLPGDGKAYYEATLGADNGYPLKQRYDFLDGHVYMTEMEIVDINIITPGHSWWIAARYDPQEIAGLVPGVYRNVFVPGLFYYEGCVLTPSHNTMTIGESLTIDNFYLRDITCELMNAYGMWDWEDTFMEYWIIDENIIMFRFANYTQGTNYTFTWDKRLF